MFKLEIPNLIRKNNFYYVKGSGHRFMVPILNKDLALFIGLIYGDGWLTSRKNAKKKSTWTVGLVGGDIILVRKFVYLAKKLFNLKFSIYNKKNSNAFEARINNRILYEFIHQNFELKGGKKAQIIKIPYIIKENKLVDPFLCGLFSTDGGFSIYKNYWKIRYCSSSKKMIKEVYNYLKNKGFNPKVSINIKRENPLYGVTLYGKDQINLYYRYIGFISKKQEILKNYIKHHRATLYKLTF